MSAPPLTSDQAADCLARLGVSVIPIASHTKEPPVGFKWGEYATRRADASERYEWFAEAGHQLAVVAGPVSGDLVPLDYDGPGGYESHAERFPILRTFPRVRTGSGKVHVWIRVKRPTKKYVTVAPDGSRLEVRAGTHYTVCPPSIHPNGTPYRWEVEPWAGIPVIDLEEIGLAVVDTTPEQQHAPLTEGDRLTPAERARFVAALQPHWTDGQRKDFTLYGAGFFANHAVPEADARAILLTIADLAEDGSDQPAMTRWIADTYTKARAGVAVAGWSALHKLIATETAAALDRIMHARHGLDHGITPASGMRAGDPPVIGPEPASRDMSESAEAEIARLHEAVCRLTADNERFRTGFDRVRCVARRRLTLYLRELRRGRALESIACNPYYQGRVAIVREIASGYVAARVDERRADGKRRLRRWKIARDSGQGEGTVTKTFDCLETAGLIVREYVHRDGDDPKVPPTKELYADMPGLALPEAADAGLAELLTLEYLARGAPARKRVSPKGNTHGGARTKPACGRCGPAATIEETVTHTWRCTCCNTVLESHTETAAEYRNDGRASLFVVGDATPAPGTRPRVQVDPTAAGAVAPATDGPRVQVDPSLNTGNPRVQVEPLGRSGDDGPPLRVVVEAEQWIGWRIQTPDGWGTILEIDLRGAAYRNGRPVGSLGQARVQVGDGYRWYSVDEIGGAEAPPIGSVTYPHATALAGTGD